MQECIIELQSGTGGLDANQWTEMLLNMYTRYFNKKQYKYETLDVNRWDGGIKSAMLKVQVKSFNLMSENGIHRLVRISPFNKQRKRQTSFASVRVYDYEPETTITISDKDLEWSTFRSSGAGGQHVNTTDSAVRVKHKPTGIVIQCQNERSQLRNKETALRVLHMKVQQASKKSLDHGSLIDITWGQHFRSYVLDPYKAIKDDRLNVDVKSDVMVDRVLNGDLSIILNGNKA